MLAGVSLFTGGLGCIILMVNILIGAFSGVIGSINVLRHGWFYIVPALLAVLTGIIALALPKRHRAQKKRRAVIGTVLGFVMLVWVIYWIFVVVPWTMIPEYGAWTT